MERRAWRGEKFRSFRGCFTGRRAGNSGNGGCAFLNINRAARLHFSRFPLGRSAKETRLGVSRDGGDPLLRAGISSLHAPFLRSAVAAVSFGHVFRQIPFLFFLFFRKSMLVSSTRRCIPVLKLGKVQRANLSIFPTFLRLE